MTAAARELASELEAEPEPLGFWDAVRDHRHPALTGDAALWRLSLPQTAPIPPVGDVLAWDWAGAQVWLRSAAPAATIWQAAAAAGGHASLFRRAPKDSNGACEEVFQPLAPAILALHQRLKAALDPAGVLNPGRMYGAL